MTDHQSASQAESGAILRDREAIRRRLSSTRRKSLSGDLIAGPEVGQEWLLSLAETAREVVAENRQVEFEAGVRQAIEWLRAEYPYGEGPDWRENGAEWIAERLADWRADRPTRPGTSDGPEWTPEEHAAYARASMGEPTSRPVISDGGDGR